VFVKTTAIPSVLGQLVALAVGDPADEAFASEAAQVVGHLLASLPREAANSAIADSSRRCLHGVSLVMSAERRLLSARAIVSFASLIVAS
jgi:hypothetical protein